MSRHKTYKEIKQGFSKQRKEDIEKGADKIRKELQILSTVSQVAEFPQEKLAELLEVRHSYISQIAGQEQQQDIESMERELIIILESLYQQQIRQAKEEERRIMIETLLLRRFCFIDEQLSTVIELLVELSPNEFLPLLLQSSREELLARFNN